MAVYIPLKKHPFKAILTLVVKAILTLVVLIALGVLVYDFVVLFRLNSNVPKLESHLSKEHVTLEDLPGELEELEKKIDAELEKQIGAQINNRLSDLETKMSKLESHLEGHVTSEDITNGPDDPGQIDDKEINGRLSGLESNVGRLDLTLQRLLGGLRKLTNRTDGGVVLYCPQFVEQEGNRFLILCEIQKRDGDQAK